MSPRTLRHWNQKLGRYQLPPRGRPPVSCHAESRNGVIRFLHQVTGPCISLDALRSLFPDVAVCTLQDLWSRYACIWKRRYAKTGFRLTWHGPGRVWAIDHSETSCLIDGCFRYLFAARDLSCHYQLAWAPCETTRADEATALLKELFVRHGPPVILKSDNGSAFIAQEMDELLQEYGVIRLPNPPRRPQYNGALERSNGTLKTYTQRYAIRQGHPLRWTSDDLEKARMLANTITRPWGHRGSSPQEAWDARTPICQSERDEFKTELDRQYMAARKDLGLTSQPVLNRHQQGQLDRLAISRTAELKGCLTVRRNGSTERPQRVSKQDALQRVQQLKVSAESLPQQVPQGASSDEKNNSQCIQKQIQ